MSSIPSTPPVRSVGQLHIPSLALSELGIQPLVARSLAELADLRPSWLEFRQRWSLTAPNADPDRFTATVASLGMGVSPYVAFFRTADGTKGGIIGRISRHAVTHRIGYLTMRGPTLRCLDVVYGGLYADDERSCRAVIGHLRALLKAGVIDQVNINHLPTETMLHAALLTEIRRGWLLGLQTVDPHWTFCLSPGSFEATLRTFSKKRRNELDREGRRLADQLAERPRVAVLGSTDELDQIFEQAGRIIARTYHARIANVFADTPVWRAQLALEAQRGTLRAFFLLGGDSAIAFNIGSIYGSVLVLEALAHLPEYNRFSPGKYLLLRVFERCCAEGVTAVDYGFGDAEYKRAYGTNFQDEAVLRIYGRTPRARLAHLLEQVSAVTAQAARFLAARLGVLKKLKKTWRERLRATT